MFIPAKNFTPTDGRKIDLIVLHSMESQEKPETAENIAAWFAGSTAPRASAHFCVDNDSVVQSVFLKDVAWHAPGANHNGVGIELAGRARQTEAQWLDTYSLNTLTLAARLTAYLCRRFDVPIQPVYAGELHEGKRGVTTHNSVSVAFKKSSHWDPGPDFPLGFFLNLARRYALDGDPLVHNISRTIIEKPL